MLERLAEEFKEYELYQLDATELIAEFKNVSGITSVQEKSTKGLALRAVQNGMMGFTSTTDLKNADKIFANLREAVQFGQKEDYHFAAPDATAQKPLGTRYLELEELTDMAHNLNTRLAKHASDFELTGRLRTARVRKELFNSNQARTEQSSSITDGYLELNRSTQDDVALDVLSYFPTAFTEAEMERFATAVIKRMELLRKLESLSRDKMPVVFTPVGTQVLTLPLLSHLNGSAVYRELSPIRKKIGEKIFDGCFSITDDPTVTDAGSSRAFDDEGVPCQKMELVEKGVVQNFYHSLKTAARTTSAPTGNGMRGGLGNQPVPSTSNIQIAAGATSLDELIGDISEGLLVETVMGMGQSNMMNGDFSNSVGSAFKIEKGRVVGRVKGYAIAGNIYELLKNIGGLSQERENQDGSYLAPYMRFDDMNVFGGD